MDIDRIASLCTTDSMSLAELSEDSQFAKLPKDQIENYLTALRKIAIRKAVKVKGENTSLRDICKARDVTVRIVDQPAGGPTLPYRAEIYYQERKINISKQSIMQMANQLQDLTLLDGYHTMAVNEIIDIHIAHELYHLLEYLDGEETGSLLPTVVRYKIGTFEKRAQIVRASEAAAHIFCMELLKLPFHPKLLDYLYLLRLGKVTEAKLLTFLTAIQAKAKVGLD
jgi:hypothetical protein